MDFLVLLKAFAVGGLLCVIGQILLDLTKLTPAKILVGYVVVGVILAGVGVYDPLVDWAGSGATVPLTGFGYAMVEGTREIIKEDGFLGVITGPLSSASAGITAAIAFGLLLSFIAKPKVKG